MTQPLRSPALWANDLRPPSRPYSLPISAIEHSFYRQLIADLREARRNKGISQEEMSEIIGVSDGLVAKWETLRKLPSTYFLMLWANALGLTIRMEPI